MGLSRARQQVRKEKQNDRAGPHPALNLRVKLAVKQESEDPGSLAGSWTEWTETRRIRMDSGPRYRGDRKALRRGDRGQPEVGGGLQGGEGCGIEFPEGPGHEVE